MAGDREDRSVTKKRGRRRKRSADAACAAGPRRIPFPETRPCRGQKPPVTSPPPAPPTPFSPVPFHTPPTQPHRRGIYPPLHRLHPRLSPPPQPA
ncbi:hypothetical protein GQ55_7G328400 [Panicum hallii var. hallii]|uniref:Uncharacterized protein n=1 Tax=Panicum hallii var. hallii TaxID=1504633 RepID=A0A2T7D1J6_9POAL|nr:hypothetical protein GQ55_7G328400 [Panicum hallii var. hallii]